MSRFPVSQEKETALEKRLVALGIFENDLEEQFVRSQGHGGQNINKISSCVVLTHRPTGLQVKCQQERSQAMNRFFARRLLADKMEKQIYGKKLAEEKERHKIRKQKKRRSRKLKAKLREDKEHRQKKKVNRLSIKSEEH